MRSLLIILLSLPFGFLHARGSGFPIDAIIQLGLIALCLYLVFKAHIFWFFSVSELFKTDRAEKLSQDEQTPLWLKFIGYWLITITMFIPWFGLVVGRLSNINDSYVLGCLIISFLCTILLFISRQYPKTKPNKKNLPPEKSEIHTPPDWVDDDELISIIKELTEKNNNNKGEQLSLDFGEAKRNPNQGDD